MLQLQASSGGSRAMDGALPVLSWSIVDQDARGAAPLLLDVMGLGDSF